LKLFPHQAAAVDRMERQRFRGCLWMDIGTGKTLTGLSILRKIRERDYSARMVVIAPLTLLETAWVGDILKFTDFTWCNLRKGFKPAHIYLLNFEQLLSKTKMALLRQIGGFLFVDESARIRNPTAKTTKALHALIPHYTYRVCASGCPAPNTELDYWAQIFFTNPEQFPYSFFLFRARYFHLTRGKETASTLESRVELYRKGFRYTMKPQIAATFHGRLAAVSYSCRAGECLDLPETTDQIRKITMPPELRAIYKRMEKDALTFINQEAIAAPIALTKLIKLREICSGFAFGEKSAVAQTDHNKLKEVKAICEETTEPILWWVQFRQEAGDIGRLMALNDLGKFAFLLGSTPNKEFVVRSFQRGKTRHLIAHPLSAAHGLTFVNCRIQVFYSLSFSYEQYEQCRGRTHRIGQDRGTIYIHLITEKSIEENIFRVVKTKGQTSDIVRDFISGKRSPKTGASVA
jgi:SNF2 family DNA or RNA helicase